MESYLKKEAIIIFFFLIGLSYKCLSQNTITNVVLQGELINAPTQAYLENVSELSSFMTNSSIKITLDSNRQFTLRFHLNEATYFKIGRNILYIFPNDSLQFVINFKDPLLSKFVVDKRGINDYLKNTPLPKMGSFLIGGDKVTNNLKETVDTILKLADLRAADLMKNKKISKEFLKMEKGRIKSDIINSLIYLEFYFPLVNKIPNTEIDAFKVSYSNIISSYLDKISKELLDPTYLQLAIYRSILYKIIEKNPPFKKNPEIKIWVKANEILEDIYSKADKSSLLVAKKKISRLPNTNFKTLLLKYIEGKLIYSNGDIAIPFNLYDINEQKIELD